MDRELFNFLNLLSVRGVGYKFLYRFYETYGTFGENFGENLREFLKERLKKTQKVEEILTSLKREEGTKGLIKFLETYRVRVIPFFHPLFPKGLEGKISASALFVLGDFDFSLGFSVVGTRKASKEGLERAFLFGQSLAERGYLVVSGGAVGIDTQAHKGALKAGKSALVLGEGLYFFLKRKGRFAREILDSGGFILSQFLPFERGRKWTFPQRDITLAYLGLYGTLVVEAKERGGSLITASWAFKMGRPLYVYLPNEESPNYRGNLKLLGEGKGEPVLSPSGLLKRIGKPT